jgi:hypothetical protein
VQIDYTYDTSNFFGAGNPQGAAAGAQAKTALGAAASYFSSILTDSFSAIQVPAPFHSSISNGVVNWSWSEVFLNPSTGANLNVVNPNVAANQYVIYAGGQNMTGGVAGIGAVGGYSYVPWTLSGTNLFTQAELNQIPVITDNFTNAINTRGQPSGFANWGGVISFDNSARTWHFDYTTQPTAGQTDFYSIALHELAHALGFGETTDSGNSPWESNVSGSQFFGNNAEAANGFQPVPLASAADIAHWAQGTQSVVYGTSIQQEAVMTPSINDGQRKKVTALDVAALKDIGWTVIAPLGVNGDYNGNGVVDAADYVIWRDHLNQNFTLQNDTTPGTVTQADYNVWRSNFGASAGSGSGLLADGSAVPEPSASVLFLACSVALPFCRRLGRGIQERRVKI